MSIASKVFYYLHLKITENNISKAEDTLEGYHKKLNKAVVEISSDKNRKYGLAGRIFSRYVVPAQIRLNNLMKKKEDLSSKLDKLNNKKEKLSSLLEKG